MCAIVVVDDLIGQDAAAGVAREGGIADLEVVKFAEFGANDLIGTGGISSHWLRVLSCSSVSD